MRSRMVSPWRSTLVSPMVAVAFVGFGEAFEQVHLRVAFFLRAAVTLPSLFAERCAGSFAHGKQAGFFAFDFHETVKVFQMCAESLRDLARGVVFQHEAAFWHLLPLDSSSSSLSLSSRHDSAFTVGTSPRSVSRATSR